MIAKDKITKVLVFMLFSAISLSGIVISEKGFSLRPFHLATLIIMAYGFITDFKLNIISFSNTLKYTWIFYFLFVIPIGLLNSFSFLLSIKLYINIWINIFLGLVLYSFLDINYSIEFFKKIVIINLQVVCVIIVIQFALALIGLYKPVQFGETGLMLLGRPAAFFGDPGWVAYWIIFLSVYLFYFKKQEEVSLSTFMITLGLMFCTFIINQSRVTMFLVILNSLVLLNYKILEKLLIIAFGFISTLFIVFLIVGNIVHIPENMYYDIIDVNRNPRIYDGIAIITHYFEDGNFWFGNGLGSISRLVEYYPCRNFTNAHNVLFLQILNDSGLIGIISILFLFVLLYREVKCKLSKIIILEFFFMLNIHNIFPYFQMFWVLLFLFILIDKKFKEVYYE